MKEVYSETLSARLLTISSYIVFTLHFVYRILRKIYIRLASKQILYCLWMDCIFGGFARTESESLQAVEKYYNDHREKSRENYKRKC